MKTISFILSVLIIFTGVFAKAQTVTNVKEKKVLIDLNGEAWSAGDRVFAMDDKGKKKALLQIKQVKNGKAVAEIVKGAALPGMALIPVHSGSSGASETSSSATSARGFRTKPAYGFTAALMMNTMKISNFSSRVTGSSVDYSFDMVGTNFGASMFYDYPLSSAWFVRGQGTLEMFDVSKKMSLAICKNDTSPNCMTTFLQTGLYGSFNYSLTPAPLRFWVGGGGGALIYLSKDSTVLNTSKFFFNTMLMAAGGVDYFMSRNTFIPITLEYQMIPDKEAGVTSIVIRGGWGKTF